MFSIDDVYTLECNGEASPLDAALALQRAINGGLWSLKGSYGRSMMDAIEAGQCCLGTAPARDYWGNFIPSRDMVMDGTKGSLSFVEEQHGAAWRKAIEEA